MSGESVQAAFPQIRTWLDAYKKTNYFSDHQITYEMTGTAAVYHFFKVISSLNSQIIGEPQITGQVKDSYRRAYDQKVTNTFINKMFNYGLQVEKEVRNDTFLSNGAISVSFAGVELARKIFDKVDDKTVLLIGSGQTAELAAVHFKEIGIQNIYISSRTYGKAEQLAKKFSGKVCPLTDLQTILEQVDIVISATSSPDPIVTKEMIEPVCKAKHHKPIFLIDLAVPRDIDPAMDSIDGVYLYNLDDLQDIVQMNLEKRKKEIPKALKIVDAYILEFEKWASVHSMAFVIKRLKDHFDTLRNKEMERLRNRLPKDNHEDIDYLTLSIANKLMHQHIKSLKKYVTDPSRYRQYVEFISDLYELDIEQ